MKKQWMIVSLLVVIMMGLAACGKETNEHSQQDPSAVNTDRGETSEVNEKENAIIPAHQGINQEPVPVKVERVGEHEVNVEMTAQITDIEIEKDSNYKAWTFNGEAPGPTIVVKEGDMINFTLKNLDPQIPHSMDFHAVQAAPDKKFADVMPNEEGTFQYLANKPGVFMYHCGTEPVLGHIANGMHGVMIVQPEDGYPTDDEVDKEFVIIQNEWYDYNDMDDMLEGEPNQVVFSAKALKEGGINTNGTTYSLKENPLQAQVGDRIRFYVNNMGPNETSSFHVIGTIMEDVYIDGNPANHMEGMQTVMLPASGGAVVEFTVTEAGTFPFVTHQFNHATKGAKGLMEVTE
ncbi:multicopper oxidase domain-containing protein [Salinibacillus aidingensis]|uniref:multicopper oxidase domain-containing protein n=1 Tax=Virgibacillus sp. MSP4-1 TaxID=2700081 RepID=UPI0005C52398